MAVVCTRPQCRLQLPTDARRCDCGAPTRPRVALALEARGGACSNRWRFTAPGMFRVGRASRSAVDAAPEVDLAALLSDPTVLSRHLLTLVWTGGREVRITRVGEHGEVAVDGAPVAPRQGVTRALPARVVLPGALELHLEADES